MGGVLGALLVIGLVVLGTVKAVKSEKMPKTGSSGTVIRCPTCGAEAKVRGSTWECGWCGDFGRYTKK